MDLRDRGLASARSQWANRTLGVVGNPIFQRHPAMRWLVPAGVVGVVAMVATGILRAGATSEDLPTTSPAALIAAARQPSVSGFSGTAVSRVSLGLPELPTLSGSSAAATFASMLTGTHTLSVWYGGPDKQRIALLGATEESDIFRNGRQLWRWDSADRVAVHTVLPADAASGSAVGNGGTSPAAAASEPTPQDLGRRMLNAIEPSTRVRVLGNRTVADRTAYELAFSPRSASTLVGSVHVQIDGQTKIPLGVQIYPRGSNTAAVDLSYTSIHFVAPADTYFHFSPPSGAYVTNEPPGTGLGKVLDRVSDILSRETGARDITGGSGATGPGATVDSPRRISKRVRVFGSNWSTVVEYDNHAHLSLPGSLKQLTTHVNGSWGRGRLLQTSLVCVLVTHNGRVFAGGVTPNALYAAAGRNH